LLGTAEPHVFEERGSFLEAIADQVAIALNSAQLAGEAAELEILRELNRLRSELLANVSHEIRTPLGLIEVLASSLRMEDVELDAVTQEEFLAGIAEETQRLKALVNNLLNLSQVESGTLRPFLEAVDLNRLARSRARTFQGQTTEHLLLVEMPSEPLLAQVDEREVDQVFTNLLGNAIRYSPDGGTIRIGGRREGDRILLSVADGGAGILPDEQKRIFDRFYRGESELVRRVGGVGLGLAVCKGIVESYGGRIWVDSTPGLGSTFHFTLPAAEGP
jgi:K+-sensing histidine kinase KdpD